MKISVIVCTRNRAAALTSCLNAIAGSIAFARADAEVVIIDNGSTDHTFQVVREWAQRQAFPVRSIFERRQGLANARNRAIRSSTGGLLIFTDDDCQMDREYLGNALAHYAGDREPVMRGGRVELGDPGDYPLTIKTDEAACVMTDVHFPGGFLLGCNMLIPRAVIDRVGLFDPRFGAGAPFRSAEDTDYIYRVYKARIRVEYVPDVVVRHYHGRRGKGAVTQLLRGYYVGNGALYAKHWADKQLWRHFYWDCRKWFYELGNGGRLYPDLGISHRLVVLGNVQGFLLYLFYFPVTGHGPRAT